MIRVIAADMDGTLLNNNHEMDLETYLNIKKACKQGIRFIIVTGRNFQGAMEVLNKFDLNCDYIISSGAEIRNSDEKILKQIMMNKTQFPKIMECFNGFDVSVAFSTDLYDYRLGTLEEIEECILYQAKLFHLNQSDEEIKQSALYKRFLNETYRLNNINELNEKCIPVYKISMYSNDVKIIDNINKDLNKIPDIAIASSFPSNLEITHINAQKGLALKEYIETLGYTMDEVMVIGDSMNDYSMLSMEFGATVAMANGMTEVKKIAKYITKSNEELGAAYAIELALNNRLHLIENCNYGK